MKTEKILLLDNSKRTSKGISYYIKISIIGIKNKLTGKKNVYTSVI